MATTPATVIALNGGCDLDAIEFATDYDLRDESERASTTPARMAELRTELERRGYIWIGA